jgi:hypothetical protein
MAGKSNKAKKGKGVSPNSGPANTTEPESKLVESSVVVSDGSPTDTNPPNDEANRELGNTDTEVHTDEAPAAVKDEEADEKPSPGKQGEGSALVCCEFLLYYLK